MHAMTEIDRRRALHGIMMLIGASTVAGCSYRPGSESPAKLSSKHLKLLDLVADTMIPETDTLGALKAGVPKRLAAMYTDWASDETRADLSGALDRIDANARARTKKDFAELSPTARLNYLLEHEKAALKPVPRKPGEPEGSFFSSIPAVADVGYHRLKELILTLHYSSEAALNGELLYEHVPGPWQPSLKITPGMRPFATLGPF
jgi:gluconate 2-dehydrogenase gamma chain